MHRWSTIGVVALLTAAASLAALFRFANWHSTWTLVGLLVFIALLVAGIVAIIVGTDHYSVGEWNAPAHNVVRSAYLDADEMRYRWQTNLVAPLTATAHAYSRADAACAGPAATPVALARATEEKRMRPQESGPSTATADRIAADDLGVVSVVAHRDQILRHLIEQYLTGDSLPRATPNRLTVAQFHRLYRYVVQEGYGE